MGPDIVGFLSYIRQLYWKHTTANQVIEFDNTPFSLGEKRTLHCQYGTHYYKLKPHTSNRVFLQGTRKKGCLAHIEIVQFNLYPQSSVKSAGSWWTHNRVCS